MQGITRLRRITTLSFLIAAPWASADHAADATLEAVSRDMVAIARELLDTMAIEPSGIEPAVGYHRRSLALLDHDDPARSDYVYWPHLREGLPIDYMTGQQRSLVHQLLNSALSAKGYLGAIQIMQMERILAEDEAGGFPRGPENYTLAIFGEPAEGQRWGWRFEGHHLSLNFSVSPGAISVTPSFWGASPALINSGPFAGFRNLRGSHEAGLALVNALDAEQQALAIADGSPPFDILSGNLNRPRDSWDDWKQLPPQGIAVRDLQPQQKDLVQRVLDEVVTSHRPEISQAYLAQIDVNTLRFVWFGGIREGEAHYYRLEGPDFFFEYDLVQSNGNHVHAVWRSKAGDFGADLLLQHRQTAHQP